MTIIKNVCELINTLTERLMQDAIDRCKYQIDLYLYVDDQGNARIEDFINVGGNSWLQDDHYLLHSFPQHCESIFDDYDDISELADALEMDEWDLIHRAWYVERDPGDIDASKISIDFIDVIDYIRYDDELMERLRHNSAKCIRDNIGYYHEQAIYIINCFEDLRGDIEIERPEGGV